MNIHLTFLRHALIAAFTISTLQAVPAYAFADDEARRAILDLREQLHQMREHERRIRLEFADEIELLKQEIMSLRGQVEQLKWVTRPDDTAAQGAGDIQVADPQEQAAFESPITLFRSGNYKDAIGAFSIFIDAYPDSELTPEARFYRGSSQYATKQFKDSIAGLQQLIAESPQHPRAADALLVIAASQIELDDLAGAKASLQRIVSDYPSSTAAQTAQERLKLL